MAGARRLKQRVEILAVVRLASHEGGHEGEQDERQQAPHRGRGDPVVPGQPYQGPGAAGPPRWNGRGPLSIGRAD